MSTINVDTLWPSMLAAFEKKITSNWLGIRDYVETEMKKLAQCFAAIVNMQTDGTLDKEQARRYFAIQKNATLTVLLSIQGLTLIAIEQALDAALSVVKDTVDKALGWPLL